MGNNGKFTATFLLLHLFMLVCAEPIHSSERDLIRSLLANYDADSRPVRDGNQTIHVKTEVQLQQVLDMDEKNQVLYTSLVLKLQWCDSTLVTRMKRQFEPESSQFDCMTDDGQAISDSDVLLVVKPSQIWTPDLYVYNNAADGKDGQVTVEESRPRVNRRGWVTWILPITVQSTCSVNVLYFPFDHQICALQFASWTYDCEQLQLELQHQSAGGQTSMLHRLIENVELAVAEIRLDVMNRTNQNGQEFSQVELKMHIRRRTLFHGYTVIAPSVLLCILTLSSFCLPIGNARKVDIGLTVFLFLYFLQVVISENTPESNSLPLIGMFLTAVISLNSLSIICATIVFNLTANSRQIAANEPSAITWLITGQILGRLTCLQYKQPENNARQQEVECKVGDGEDLHRLHPKVSTPVTRCDPQDSRWLHIASVTDRLLFILYLMFTSLLLFAFLIYMPYYSGSSASLELP